MCVTIGSSTFMDLQLNLLHFAELQESFQYFFIQLPQLAELEPVERLEERLDALGMLVVIEPIFEHRPFQLDELVRFQLVVLVPFAFKLDIQSLECFVNKWILWFAYWIN